VIDATEGKTDGAWSRLRRRKVVQWGLIYAAAAWGFLQGLEYVSATYDWPRHIQQYATLAFLIGLPIALVLAWYHGDRGQRRITTPEFAIVTLLLLLGGGVFWYYQRASEAGRNDLAQTATMARPYTSSGTKDARPSIAVLTFENRSRLEDDAFFVGGIHDDILTQLSKVSALRVISRTSVERFRKTELSIQQIAQQLGVKSILEGGVQRAGDRVRINVQLIDAATDAHHWAETYDRELTAANIFAIQSELAQAIAGALKAALTPAEQARSQIVPTQISRRAKPTNLGNRGLRSVRALASRTRSTFSERRPHWTLGLHSLGSA
jgi:TolB-like protein